MSFEPDVLQGFVQRYLDTAASGSADDVAALYAEDATLEDPVGGGEVHIGRHELLSFRAGGSEAAFVFAITVGGSLRIEPIEIMAFNAEGQITSMRAFWGPADITQI
ncbi:MAG: hypothetical protein K0R33_606 [Mycobacterium sp.]|nr:hypothetical protein [Mycobacterium sp.]